jgi:trans-2,3-dihydro-3-hydroxyanthranilate isomerase
MKTVLYRMMLCARGWISSSTISWRIVKVDFYTCDVFTRRQFGGNQLAVIPDARGLNKLQMQQIAREFNYSETTFVLPPEKGHDRKVRIFTPTREVPFAGHPNIGTAFVLANNGLLGDISEGRSVTFEEKAGLVEVSITRQRGGSLWCELLAPQELTLGQVVMPELAAPALSLDVADIRLNVHPPCVAGVGLPFLVVELSSEEALERASFNMLVMEALQKKRITPDILLYTRAGGDVDIKARMFAPIDGVPEDPATGSANCALAALLTHHDAAASGEFSWKISQGVEMGRPSVLYARTQKTKGKVTATWIGGDSVMVSKGELYIGQD